MSRRLVSYVLARAADQGRSDAITLAARKVDPVLRGRVIARAHAAYAHAVPEDEPLEEAHALRLATLDVLGLEAGDRRDAAEVEKRFEAARRTLPSPGFPFASVAAAFALAGFAVLVALVWQHRPRPYDVLRERPPEATDAYTRGGRPREGEPPVRGLFADALPRYVVAVDRRARGLPGADAELDATRRRVLSDENRAAVGARVYSAVAALTRAGESYVAEPDDGASLLGAIADVNEAIERAGLAYYVDATILGIGKRRVVYVQSFEVHGVELQRAGARTEQVLHLSRIDRLNLQQSLLGYTRPEANEAIVLLDRIEEDLVLRLLPSLAEGAPLTITDARDLDPMDRWATNVMARARSVAEQELGGSDPTERRRTAELGKKLAERLAILQGWQESLLERGVVIRVPGTLHLDLETSPWAELRARMLDARRLAELTRELGEPEPCRTFLRVRSLLAESVARHEVQHRLDYQTRGGLRIPAELAFVLGSEVGIVPERPLDRAATYELSAYLAELARDRKTLRTNVTLLARYLLDRRLGGGGESYAALVIFEGLVRELGRDVGPLRVGRHLDRGHVADAYLVLTDTPPDEVREAAKRLWRELFGAPLPRLQRISR